MGGDDHVYVEVEDDGVGFDTDLLTPEGSGRKRFGLFSIRERLRYLGGHLQVESSPGGGTKVSMMTPLRTE